MANILFRIWDRESLVQWIIGALDIGIADRTEGPLFALVGAIDDGSVTEIAIETFSRRWISLEADPSACILEAAWKRRSTCWREDSLLHSVEAGARSRTCQRSFLISLRSQASPTCIKPRETNSSRLVPYPAF